MSREVRMVPANWKHPKDTKGRFIPLLGDDFKVEAVHQSEKHKYMPDWPESERTHYQMYEVITEGTPISPVMETPEALARWLTDNNEPLFADTGTTYEHWLEIIKRGWSVGVVAQQCD